MENEFYTDSTQLGTRSIDESTGFLHASVITAVAQSYEYAEGVLYKSPEALQKSCESYQDKPINFGDHLPSVMFDVNTPKDEFVGFIKNATYEDGGVKANVVITDKKVIEYIQNNKNVTVSPAFTANITEKNGKRYQDDIKINSLTIIDSNLGVAPRGGNDCRFLDTKEKDNMDKEKEKELKEKIKLQTDLDSAIKDFADAKKELEEVKAKNETLSKENEDLKKQYADSEKNFFIDSVSNLKMDFSDCQTTADCKRKILNENNFLGKTYSSESNDAINAYFDAYSSSVKQKEDSKKSFNASLNSQNNGEEKYEQSALDAARKKYYNDRNGGQ